MWMAEQRGWAPRGEEHLVGRGELPGLQAVPQRRVDPRILHVPAVDAGGVPLEAAEDAPGRRALSPEDGEQRAPPALGGVGLSSEVISEFQAICGAITSTRWSIAALVSWMPPP